MTTTQKTILISGAIIILAGIAGYAYITRPAPAPSITVDESPNGMNPTMPPGGNPAGDSLDESVSKTLNLEITSASTAEFRLNEVLRGTPTLVVGTTNNVSGNVSVTTSPAKVAAGDIRINARTFKTDNTQRDGAIVRMVLHSDQAANEFIVFKNIQFTGLPSVIEVGKTFAFTAKGDLTISGTTQPATFTGTAKLNADNSLTGTATSTIVFGDWDISVPNLPFLANVDKEAKLTLKFVAK